MKKMVLFTFGLLILLSMNSSAQIISAASGLWNATTTWVGGVIPATTSDVYIANGHTVTVPTGTHNCRNLTVYAGGTLTADGDNLVSSNLRYIRAYGDSIINYGTIGTGIDGLSIDNRNTTTKTIVGLNIKFAKIRAGGITASAVLNIEGDVTLSYDGAALQFQNAVGQNITTVNVKPGAKLTTTVNADITTASSVNTDVTDFAPVINIQGTVVVGGIITLRSTFGAPSIVVTSPGTLTVNENLRLTTTLYANPGIISGTGSFTLGPNSRMEVAMADGLNPVTGQIRTATRVFPSTAGYTFVGTAAQVTGAELPAVVGRLGIDNAAGLTLTGNVRVDTFLTITKGKIETAANTLSLNKGAAMSGEDSSKYVVGKLVSTQTVLGDSASTLGGIGVLLGAGTDNLGDVVVTRISGIAGEVTVNGKSGIRRRWAISSANPVTAGRNLSFTWVKDDDNGRNLTKATVYKSYDFGANWTPVGVQQNFDSLRLITINVTSFGDFTVSDDANVIPVELVSFAANVSGKDIILSWKTATELNNKGWEIERAITNGNNKMWNKIGFVNGAGTTTSPNNYSFADNNVLNGKYSYRLKQIDLDGTMSYSKTIEVDYQGRPASFAVGNYPNPFNPETRIRFEIPVTSFVNITIFNTIGEKVAVLVNENYEAGVYERSFKAENLNTGIYFYKMTAGTYSITKKMILSK